MRYFYALDVDKSLENVSEGCHHCSAIKSVPVHLHPQTTSQPPDAIGTSFAADVIKRYRQLVLVLRETVSSYTLTCFIENEKHNQLRDSILVLCAEVRSLGDGGIRIRVDPAPGLQALISDPILNQYGISLEMGHAKNVNKNPVAEHAIQEIGVELLHLSPDGGPISKVTLALATANLNSRIRRDGLSARELWTQRDQVTGEQLPIVDREIIIHQNLSRIQNHPASAKSKTRGSNKAKIMSPQVGDLVYLRGERDKTKARDKYIVTDITGDSCKVRKFTMSQFRSKTYDIQACECYPVLPSMLPGVSSGPIRGLDDSESQDGDAPLVPPPAFNIPVIHERPIPPLPSAIVAPPPPAIVELQEDEVFNSDNNTEVIGPASPSHHAIQEDSIIVTPDTSQDQLDTSITRNQPRRSNRVKQAPKWQSDDTWELSSP